MQTQVPRVSIQYAVDPVEHSRVSGEPLCVPEDSIMLQRGPVPSSASAPVPRNKSEYTGQSSRNFRAGPAQSQNSVAQGCNQANVQSQRILAFEQGGDGVLRFQGRLCVPMVDGLQERIMEEAHSFRYSIHPGSTKMYCDLREVYWWNGMKKDIAEFVVKCPNCQQVKTDGQAERTIQTLEDMLRACVIDFKGNWKDHLPLIEFAYNNNYHSSIQMAPYEALYGRRCRSPIGWFEVGEAGLIGPDLVHQAMEKVKVIQERLKMAQSRQKSYTDVRRRALEFEIDDWVYLKVSPVKGVMRFGKKGKLSPRYIGPYRICIGDPSLILPTESVRIKDNLSYEEIPVQILDRQVRRLRTKDVASVKVFWRNQFVEEATWEAEEDMKKRYLYLFEFGENADQV
ncbi:uncharacterized protein LOC125838428 [Solanum verrucosum]|uniref:uncharacterized protein LOC125838428 n=1 Tax=Solanum verrucosum TaxID=315347 RepID=UPI0020D1A3E2|nr:uncharacterized protein LOC125838428 [Solanum verrucosum]